MKKPTSKRLKTIINELREYQYYYVERYKGGTGDLATLFREASRQVGDAQEIIRDLENAT